MSQDWVEEQIARLAAIPADGDRAAAIGALCDSYLRQSRDSDEPLLSVLRHFADNSDREAIFQIGQRHLAHSHLGICSDDNWTQGLDCLTAAAEMGHPRAAGVLADKLIDPYCPKPDSHGSARYSKLALCLLDGMSYARIVREYADADDCPAALLNARRAAVLGASSGHYYAALLLHGMAQSVASIVDVKLDFVDEAGLDRWYDLIEPAVAHLRAAVAVNHAGATRTLWEWHLEGYPGTGSRKELLGTLRTAPEHDWETRLALGLYLVDPANPLSDQAEGISILEDIAVRFANVDARTTLGDMFFFGARNAPVDQARGLYWYEKAAHLGNTDAMGVLARHHIGGFFRSSGGQGVYHGLAWFRRAEARGSNFARCQIAILYANEFSDEHDIAVALAKLVAHEGEGEGYWLLGQFHEKAIGVACDPRAAVYGYRQAVRLGRMFALPDLVNLLCEEHSGVYDPAEADMWVQYSIGQGGDAPPELPERVIAQLSPDQRVEAEARAGRLLEQDWDWLPEADEDLVRKLAYGLPERARLEQWRQQYVLEIETHPADNDQIAAQVNEQWRS